MKVLLTGAGGQLGRSLRRLADGAVRLTALDRGELDVRDERSLLATARQIQPRVIINCAAYTQVDLAESDPEMAHAVNAAGPRNLAVAAVKTGARLIHFSTDLVFDGRRTHPYSPEDAPSPLSVYGESKLRGEEAVRSICGESATIVRVSRVYSGFGSNFVETVLERLRQQLPVRVVDDQLGTFTWAARLAEAVWEIASRPAVAGTLHWSDNGIASWYEFATAIQEIALETALLETETPIEPIPTEAYPTPAPRPPFTALDTSGTRAILETPQLPWRTALRRMLEDKARQLDA